MNDYVKMSLRNKAGKTVSVWVERITDGTLVPKVGTRTSTGGTLDQYAAIGFTPVKERCAAQHTYKYKLYNNVYGQDAYWFYHEVKASSYEEGLAKITKWIETYCDNAIVSIVSVKQDKDKVLHAATPVEVRLKPVADTPDSHTRKVSKWRVCFYKKSDTHTKNVRVKGRIYKQVVHNGTTEETTYETFEGTREEVTEYIRRIINGGNGWTNGYAEIA